MEESIEKRNHNKSEHMDESFSTYILVDQPPKEAFDAITKVRAWWAENLEGSSQRLNDEFTVRLGDIHVSKQKLVEVIPEKKVVWLVTNSKLNFVEDNHAWTGTTISFDIAELGNKTQVSFTHRGLVPEQECFEACSNAWSEFIHESLFYLITTGEGQPAPKNNE